MKVLFLIVSLLCIVWTSNSWSQRSYIVGVEDLSYYPFYVNSKGDYQGFARDLLDKFSEQENIQFFYHAMPPKDLFNSLLAKEIDFKFPDNPYWQGDLKQGHDIYYSSGVLNYTDGALVLWPSESVKLSDIKVLGTINAFTPFAYLDLIDSGSLKVLEYSSLDDLVNAILHRDVDAGYFNVLIAKHFVANISLSTLLDVKDKIDIQLDRPIIEFHSELPHTSSQYYLSSKKHPELIKRFNQFLKDNQELLTLLKQKYQAEGDH